MFTDQITHGTTKKVSHFENFRLNFILMKICSSQTKSQISLISDNHSSDHLFKMWIYHLTLSYVRHILDICNHKCIILADELIIDRK